MNIVSFILLIFGLVMLVVAFCFLMYEKNRRQFDGKTDGKIIGSCYSSNEFNQDGEHKYLGGDTRELEVVPRFATTSRYPVYQYEVNGVTYRRADYIMGNEPDIVKKMNKTVTVYYQTKNPKCSTLSNGRTLRAAGIILNVSGFLFLAAAAFLFWHFGRN